MNNKETKLLTRDEFRELVFKRDQHRCVICKAPAKDAHHILERRLFTDGGYYLPNGVSLCEEDHLEAEMTRLSCEEIREKAGINEVILPPQFDLSERYDKWGNQILGNGLRLRGELFFDKSVQKILTQGSVLDQFTKYVKYPKTFHFPWSLGLGSLDKVIESLDGFIGQEVVVTVKRDGENTSIYSDYIHARSLSDNYHPSRSWIKQFHSTICHNITEGWRFCGENLYAEHSIPYRNLSSWFELFSVWNELNYCLSHDETVEWADLLGLKMVPVLYRGPWDEKIIKSLHREMFEGDLAEGYVVRVSSSFHYRDFKRVVAKFVRKNHVQTDSHWAKTQMKVNQLRKGE